MNRIDSILIFYNPKRENDSNIKYCVNRVKEIASEYCVKIVDEFEEAELIVSVGGDGTFLRAQQNVLDQLIIGITANPEESVGFYNALNRNNINLLKEVFKRNYKVRELYRLLLKVGYNQHLVLNEVQIYPNPQFRLLKAELEIRLKSQDTISSVENNSGLLVYTPTGASGYASNLGGALPLNSIGIVAIAPADGYLKKFGSITTPICNFKEIKISSSQEFLVNTDSQDNIYYIINKLEILLGESLKCVIPGRIIKKLETASSFIIC